MNRFACIRQLRCVRCSGARLALAAGLLALLGALAFAAAEARGRAAAAASSKAPASATPAPAPNFVVIQTDDQTLDQLYATYTPAGGATIGRCRTRWR